jgi:colanic acid/amylovoran biosynthesis glycosyltransferase
VSAEHNVAVFATNFLHYSQTFIYEQLQRHARYLPQVFCWRRHHAERFPFHPVHRANLAYGLTRQSPAFHRSFERERFDVVHAHFAPGAVYALPYATRYRVPLVVSFHGYDVPLYWNTRRFRPEYLPFLLRGRTMLEQMTLGLCASNELKELLISLGVSERKLRVHRLGIDLQRFHPVERTPTERVEVLCVGRFVEKKGFEYAIRAFAPFAERARLTVIGDGPRREQLRELVASLGVEHAVNFVGVLASAEVATRVAASDVLLAPSVIGRDGDRESGLIVLKEASASGVPVVATVHGGLPEIVDQGETGFLAPERDVESLSRYLAQLIEDPALRASLGRAGRAKMEREYDGRLRADALESYYDEARISAMRRPFASGVRGL